MVKDLAKIRKKNNLTQEETAEISGITRAYYSLIELGIRRPSVENAKKIASALGFDWTRFYEADPDEEAEEEPQEA
jgi:transcriptional regulator with XRE-family HTH domain